MCTCTLYAHDILECSKSSGDGIDLPGPVIKFK